MGILNEDQSKIFEEFYRVKNKQTKSIDGTGLGLSIVRKLVDKHKREIEVKSVLHKGSTFSINLPIRTI